MYRILPLLALLGCGSKLTPLQEEIVLDYQWWIDDNVERVQEYLDVRVKRWDHNINPIVRQSWDSKYCQRSFKKELTIAKSNPTTNKVYINTDSFYWEFIEDDYLFNRDALDNCGNRGDGIMHLHQSAAAAFVLCHENAHNIGIKNHSDVYFVGDVCKEVRMQDFHEWSTNCKEEDETF